VKLPSLIGIRWIAAVWIVAIHLARGVVVNGEGILHNLVISAPFAVTFFLVLSGFVITWVYAKPDFAPRSFIRSRFARVVPLYALSVLLVAPLGIAARQRGFVTDDGYASLFLVATGLQCWVPSAPLRWNPALWTISVEIFFYALFAICAPWFARARIKTLVIIGVIGWLISIGIGVAYLVTDPDGIGSVAIDSRGTWLFVLRFNPLIRLPDFLIGVAAARAFANGWRVPSWVAGLCVVGSLLLFASGAVPLVLLHGSLFAPIAVVLIVSLASGAGQRIFDSKTINFLGETSYALYALHLPIWFWVCAVLKRNPLDAGPIFTPTIALLAIVISLPAHLYVEKPVREWIMKKLRA
jgi:peptidoglycan/LPS O-acetylase OafA/YrhL